MFLLSKRHFIDWYCYRILETQFFIEILIINVPAGGGAGGGSPLRTQFGRQFTAGVQGAAAP
jgi:hypothetical protein